MPHGILKTVLALVAGLLGAVVGWLLKTLSDYLAESRANRRQDEVWRRHHYVDAVASLTHAGRALMSADSSISRAIHSLMNAERGGNEAIIADCQRRNAAASERQAPWTTATIQALEAVRLYGPDDVVDAANAVWDAILNGGSFPDVQDISAFESRVTDALQSLRTVARASAGLT